MMFLCGEFYIHFQHIQKWLHFFYKYICLLLEMILLFSLSMEQYDRNIRSKENIREND